MLILRLAVFPFFVAAVVYLVRHFAGGDRRMRIAAGWAILTAAFGGLSTIVESGRPHDAANAAMLVVMLGGSVLLGGALWVVIVVGMLLGDAQGGYWTKGKVGERGHETVLWCGISVMALLLFTSLACRFFHVPVNLAPDSTGSVLKIVLSHLSFSLAEEFFYRGCVQALLTSWLVGVRHGNWLAIGTASVIFTAQHVDPNHQGFLFLMVLPAGVVFGVLFARFGVFAAAAAHFSSNLLLTFLLPHLA